ncbi:hypothetical protein HOD83_02450 [Candidatus Woesearchaeota archaeon]|jgi:hypothetical protein|nr:hypothetical protein [Candidatus Woesearchaeota archaeon]MBT4114130.1 hypothetical protein [Candidatus Woesearchaeota archaeon]MBT4248427.1 hypothetical protein [Candidatus Woesearchaeota archaeon]
MVRRYSIGKHLGFIVADVFFFTVLFLILTYTNKLPEYVVYEYMLILALIIWIIHVGVKK